MSDSELNFVCLLLLLRDLLQMIASFYGSVQNPELQLTFEICKSLNIDTLLHVF